MKRMLIHSSFLISVMALSACGSTNSKVWQDAFNQNMYAGVSVLDN